MLQQLNQTQIQNQELQTTITQQSATISQLNQQLTAANMNAQTYEAAAVVLIIIAVALAAFSIYQARNKVKTKDTGGDVHALASVKNQLLHADRALTALKNCWLKGSVTNIVNT